VADLEGHLEDVRQAARAVRRHAPAGRLLGGGFSYGARMLARAVREDTPRRPPLEGLLLLAPAVRVPGSARDFGNLLMGRALVDAARDPRAAETLGMLPVPVRVLVGERDPVAPPGELRALLPGAAGLEVLPGLNHFFSRAPGAGATARDLLAPALDRALEELLASS
jgi:pimeloyl-ACP methyl ester carboxylesterase